MKRFSFRLARLLRVREVLEGEARATFGAAEAAAAAAEREVARQAAALVQARRESAGLAGVGATDPDAVLRGELAETMRRARLAAERRTAGTLRLQADRLRDAWLERRVERESLSRMEDRSREVWREERRLLENAELDEVARRRAGRESDSASVPPPRGADGMSREDPVGPSQGTPWGES